MVPLLALFLVALVGLPVAQALDCHVCAYNGENCFNPMRCPAMVTYCMTTRTYYTPTRMKVMTCCFQKADVGPHLPRHLALTGQLSPLLCLRMGVWARCAVYGGSSVGR
ncbi:ly-6/neurotoxin-like protein 1 isoform X5 [Monodon monoceros]|uniref:ly-6/neurotoxin-like protein 1 isoform X5 n=1 Tax=Monodon monoceros TaxID=40151 RepID=UPI0010F58F07|nr:ly-6/neurotoxin-like protein 1 isoform X5 [Monodon monoceros]